jgi:quinol monooxygenase YgiN
VVVIEQWDSIVALHTHLKTPHMLAYREKTHEMVASLSLKALAAV